MTTLTGWKLDRLKHRSQYRMEQSLLEDEEFIRIRKLNSIEGSDRRRSIVYDKPVPGLESPDEAAGEYNEDAIIGPPSEQEDEGSTTTVSLPIVETAKEEIDQRDLLLKGYLTRLHQVEKRRYRKGKDSAISFFADVDFDTRPTLLDAAVAKPLITSFEGPTFEKQIKAFEKSKKTKQVLGKLEDYQDTDNPMLKELSPQESQLSKKHGKRTLVTYHSDFSGIYILMWMIFGWISIRGLVEYSASHEGGLSHMSIVIAMTENWGQIFVFDMAMWLTSFTTVIIQYLVKWGVVNWNVTGRYLSVTLELSHVFIFNYLSNMYFEFNWISRVFFFLHSIVFLMKFHSFAFFNGYLWNIKRELDFSKRALAKCKDTVSQDIIETLERSQTFCEYELTSQSSSVSFPQNISFKSYFMFTLFPTLVYQFEYPRTKNIRWLYVLEKLCAIFGIIYLMVMNAQLFVYPACQDAMELREQSWNNVTTSTKEWFYLLAELIPAMTIEYMLTFYLIWDAILNCVAELTRFADRYFYGDWWNCVVWSEFARIWNVPVHKFLLRHVYHSSMNHWKITTVQATMFTFLLSASLHEMCMIIIYRKIRPYLFLFQLAQLPMTYFTVHTKLKYYPTLCNILFIFGVCTGPSVITCLYMIY